MRFAEAMWVGQVNNEGKHSRWRKLLEEGAQRENVPGGLRSSPKASVVGVESSRNKVGKLGAR